MIDTQSRLWLGEQGTGSLLSLLLLPHMVLSPFLCLSFFAFARVPVFVAVAKYRAGEALVVMTLVTE